MAKRDAPILCELCGEPIPEGEEMFGYHGHSGPCPALPMAEVETVTLGPERDIDRPRWMVEVEEKAEFYAAEWRVPPRDVKEALHDIFSMLDLADIGSYAESHARAEIGELAKVLMDEFGGPTRDEGAVDMAIRLLREARPAVTVPSPDRSQP